MSGAKRYTKSGYEIKFYDSDEYREFTSEKRAELYKAKLPGGTTYTKKQLDDLKNVKSSKSEANWSKKVTVVNGVPYGKCSHCDPCLNLTHTEGQHDRWVACNAIGTPFILGRNSVLAMAQRKYKYTPSSAQALPAQAKPPPVATDLVVAGIDIPSPTITLSLRKTQQLLRAHETTSDHPSSGEQVEFAKQIMHLN